MDKPTPSGREMEILKILWELGPASVRDVCRRMCPNNELAFNTIQTLLRIMDEKGLVSHKKQGRTFIYTPRYTRHRAASSVSAPRLRRRDRPGGRQYAQYG